MIRGVASESLPLPRQFGALPGYQAPGIVRNPWMRPARADGRLRGWCCQCTDETPAGAWDEAVAPYILREPEWRVWRRLSSPAARREWMRGRVAAKDAVRLLLLNRRGLAASLETIGITPDANGRPQVVCAPLPDAGADIFVSISHCGRSSVALAAERSDFCVGVGIDVASQADNHDGLAEGGFASTETALLNDISELERTDWLLRLWCAKEAAGKAIGLGLMGDPLNCIVRRVARARGEVELEVNVGAGFPASSRGPSRMTARVGCGRGMAFAVAALEEK